MKRRLLLLPLIAFASPALAAGTLPFEGAFGNASGCHLYMTGHKLSDDYLLLTPDTFSSESIGCDFNALVSSTNVDFTVDAVCSPGGKSTVRVSDFGAQGFTVSVDGKSGIFDEIKACAIADGEHA